MKAYASPEAFKQRNSGWEILEGSEIDDPEQGSRVRQAGLSMAIDGESCRRRDAERKAVTGRRKPSPKPH
jgi:hypothetical protein